jgi:hypothetical protein
LIVGWDGSTTIVAVAETPIHSFFFLSVVFAVQNALLVWAWLAPVIGA